MKTTIGAFVNWKHEFITTDYAEAVDAYLEFAGMSMEEYAINEGIVDCLTDDEEMSDIDRDECINSILDEMESDMDGWNYVELPID